MKKITIIGGGNIAHSIIPILSNANHSLMLLTRKPHDWAKEIKMEYVDSSGNIIRELYGKLDKVTDNPREIIPQSDIIILCLPVSQYRSYLLKIAPHLDKFKKIYVGAMYGQGGFNWMVQEIKNKFQLQNIVTFTCGLVPWITRIKEYGKIGINYGPKAENIVAISPISEFDELNMILLDDLCYRIFNTGKFHLSPNFISLTLSVDNQIIHLSRLYCLYNKFGGKWNSKSEVPLFYYDYDDYSEEIMTLIDEEYSKIRNKIKEIFHNKDFSYMLNYLSLERLTYNSTNNSIKQSFIESKTLRYIPTPTTKNINGDYIIDKEHRFFTDDLYYGLIIAKWIAEKLLIETPNIDKIINWAQEYINDKIMENNKLINEINNNNFFKLGIPSVYGFNRIEDIID